MKLGDLEFWLITDGTFRLDGGAMFGVIPKPLWERVSPADARNRILMAMNSLLIRAAGKWILLETGAGDKWDEKRTEIYSFDAPPRLPEKLIARGVPPEKIDIVINTHLHFDHCGWNTPRTPAIATAPAIFPKTTPPWKNRASGHCSKATPRSFPAWNSSAPPAITAT